MNELLTRCRAAALPVVIWLFLLCWSSLAAASYTITPTSRNFGTVAVGLVSNAASFNVLNTGTTPITVTGYDLAGSQFQFFGGWAPKTLNPGEGAVFDLKFAPTSGGTFSGTFTIDVDDVPNVIPLSGIGKLTTAASTLSVSTIDFGSVSVGHTSALKKFTLTNTGTSPLTLRTITIDPPFNVSGFNRSGVALKPGSSLPLQVTFHPTAVGPAKNVMVFGYDSVASNGIALSGTATPATSLAINTFPTLPLGTTRASYIASLLATGGTPPYSFALSRGSNLPAGLTLSSAGTISGTLDPAVGIGNYSFTVQVSDSHSAASSQAMTIPVLGPTGSNCNNTIWYTGQTQTPGVPLNDLGTGKYLGAQGGLYPNGSNTRPNRHDADGVAIAAGIQPLDANGNVDLVNGKIGMLSIGMSDTFDVFFTMFSNALVDPTVNRSVVFVPGAQPRASATLFADPNNAVWNPIMQNFLPQSGLTANQVVVAWVNDGNPTTGTFPDNMKQTQSNLESIVQNLYAKFPNIKLAYFGSRFYAGYSNGTVNPANPEPYAYQTGFAVKWSIEDQLNGLASLNYNPANGAVTAPWIDWGSYDWANGMLARRDGLVWTCQDLQSDGTHPSNPQGREKDANMLLNFFKTDDTTTPWFLAH